MFCTTRWEAADPPGPLALAVRLISTTDSVVCLCCDTAVGTVCASATEVQQVTACVVAIDQAGTICDTSRSQSKHSSRTVLMLRNATVKWQPGKSRQLAQGEKI